MFDQGPMTPVPGLGASAPATNVTPPGEAHLVKELQKDNGVENPYALAWWIHGRRA